jgi:hypothetical protein
MSAVSPFHDASVSGCLANASLSASVKPEARAEREGASFAHCLLREEAPAPQAAPCRAGWRRLFDTIVSLVSGPTLPQGGANRI